MDNYKIGKVKRVCMEDSIDCKIGNFQTEDNVIMLRKHIDKSVLMHLFKFPFTNTKIINQYRITYTFCSDLNSVPLYESERR